MLDESDLLSEAISREWRSESGLMFSRSEGFNYSEATVQSVTSAWASSVRSSTIKNLKSDDILLLGSGNKAVGVLKLMAVYDEAGTDNDRYVFSLKLIE